MTIITAENIQKKWGENGIVDSFTYHFEHNQIYQIIGDNGRGKTTLLKILAGLLLSDQGKCSKVKNMGWCSSKGIGEMPRLSGLENIKLMNKFIPSNLNNINEWKNFSSFNQALSTEYGKCSHGMQMLISLYISCLGQPSLLLLDEPFAHLSFENTNHFLKEWKTLTGASTIIFSAHEKLPDFQGEIIEL